MLSVLLFKPPKRMMKRDGKGKGPHVFNTFPKNNETSKCGCTYCESVDLKVSDSIAMFLILLRQTSLNSGMSLEHGGKFREHPRWWVFSHWKKKGFNHQTLVVDFPMMEIIPT